MKTKTYETKEKREKAVLVYLNTDNKKNTDIVLKELKSLVEACNIDVIGNVIQNKNEIDGKYLIGKGKLEELKIIVDESNADVVVFNNELAGGKLSNLEDYLGVRVIDRTMLILDIFARRATSSEGKLQVELAQLKYSLPRLSCLNHSEGKFGGGIGMRGPGETKLELNRRVVENKILDKQRELEKLKKDREIRREQRIKSNKKSVAIVGYTNAGKSTLLNTITKANILAKDMLFATLDTTTREVWLGEGKKIYLTDTVGFVSDLPHHLVQAFSSTLQETLDADLLLHVVDVTSDKYLEEKQIVLDVLKSLGADKIPMITLYNKTDKTDNFRMCLEENSICISALKNIGIDKLKEQIIKILF